MNFHQGPYGGDVLNVGDDVSCIDVIADFYGVQVTHHTINRRANKFVIKIGLVCDGLIPRLDHLGLVGITALCGCGSLFVEK